MKPFLLFCLFTMTLSITFSQHASFGFNMGVNFNNLQVDKNLSLNNQVTSLTSESKPGFHIGIHSLIKVANRVKFSPQLLLDFSEDALNAELNMDEKISINRDHVKIRVPLDLQLELLRGKNALYLISGAEYSANLDNNKEDLYFNTKNSFWSGRIGFGLRRNFNSFSVSPEFTFTKSFSNIKEDNDAAISQVITNIDNTILGFSIKFQGLLGD